MRQILAVLPILAFIVATLAPMEVRADGAVCRQSFAGEERDFPCIVIVKGGVANVFVYKEGEHVPYYEVKIKLPAKEREVAEKSCPAPEEQYKKTPYWVIRTALLVP